MGDTATALPHKLCRSIVYQCVPCCHFASVFCTAVALVCVVCVIVFAHNVRQARRLRYPLKDYPALAPEMLLAAVKAVAYG
jgi:hypothetical protein